MQKHSKIRGIVEAHKIKIIFVMFVLFMSFSLLYTNKTTIKHLERIDYLNDTEVGLINDSNFNSKMEYSKISGNKGLIKLENNEVIEQEYRTPVQSIENIFIYADNKLVDGSIKVTVTDDKEIVLEQDYAANDFDTQIILSLNNKQFKLDTKLTISISVQNMSENEGFSLYSYQYDKISYVKKGISNIVPEESQIFLTKTSGNSTFYHFKLLIVLTAISMLLLISLLVMCINKNINLKNKILFIVGRLEKLHLQFVFEFIVSVSLILLFLRFMIYYFYGQEVVLSMFIIIFILFSLFGCYLLLLFKRFKNDWAKLFLLLAIPIGVTFLVFMLPDAIPDEPMHFFKTVLTSNFDFTANSSVSLPNNYVERGIVNYREFWDALFSTSNYHANLNEFTPVQYSFVLYIVPSFGIMIAKLFSLSIYMGYFLARILNLILYLFIGYKTIKLTPVAKVVFFIYLFNPMMLQQAISVSADMLINSLSILFIAYILYLKFTDRTLVNKDIAFVLLFLLFIIFSKYVYLPLIAIVFILFDKIKKLNIKQIIMFFAGCILAVLIYYYFTFIGASNSTAVTTETVISPIGQIQYLLKDPLNIIMMLFNTVIDKFQFYWFSFFGRYLSWLDWHINILPISTYIILLFLSPFVAEDEKKLKVRSKIWLVLIVFMMFALIITGLYLTWTGVGASIAEGVQGRYFIPFVILLPLACSGNRRLPNKHVVSIITVSLVFVYLFVLMNILFIASNV